MKDKLTYVFEGVRYTYQGLPNRVRPPMSIHYKPVCGECQSRDIMQGLVFIDSTSNTQEFHCEGCGHEWENKVKVLN